MSGGSDAKWSRIILLIFRALSRVGPFYPFYGWVGSHLKSLQSGAPLTFKSACQLLFSAPSKPAASYVWKIEVAAALRLDSLALSDCEPLALSSLLSLSRTAAWPSFQTPGVHDDDEKSGSLALASTHSAAWEKDWEIPSHSALSSNHKYARCLPWWISQPTVLTNAV